MSAIVLAVKALGFSVSCASIIGVGAWILVPHLFGFEPYVSVYAMSERVANSDLEKSEFSTENFQCRLTSTDAEANPNNESFNCEVMQWKADNTDLKHYSIYKNFNNTPEATSLKSKNNIFQIKFRKKDWSNKDFAQKIEIVKKPISNADNSKKYATLKQLVSVHENKLIKSESYFVVKNDKSEGSFTDHNNIKCKYVDKNKKTITETCNIYEFASTNGEDYSKLIFSNSSTPATSFTEKHHYLIKFNKTIDIEDKQIFYIDDANQTTNKATFTIVKTAILAHDKLFTL